MVGPAVGEGSSCWWQCGPGLDGWSRLVVQQPVVQSLYMAVPVCSPRYIAVPVYSSPCIWQSLYMAVSVYSSPCMQSLYIAVSGWKLLSLL